MPGVSQCRRVLNNQWSRGCGGDEYDEPDLYKRAGRILGAQEKLEAKVRARTEPYKYANTAVSVDFGGVKQGDQDDEPASNVDGDVADVKDAA